MAPARIDETALTKEGHAPPGLWLLVALLIGAPGLVVTMQAAPIPPSALPSPLLDAFIAAVRDRTPQTARVLVAGNPPALVFYRATYLLYPRAVYTAFPTDYAHGGTAPPTGWPSLRRLARRDGADYVLLWALPIARSGVTPIRSKDGSGALVQLGNGLRLTSHGKPRTLKCLSSSRAREKSATGVSTGTAAVPAAMLAGARCAKPGRVSRDDVPQGLRRSQWVTGVRSGQFTDPLSSPHERPSCFSQRVLVRVRVRP